MVKDAGRANDTLSRLWLDYLRDKRRAQALVAAEAVRLMAKRPRQPSSGRYTSTPSREALRRLGSGVQSRRNSGRVTSVR
jgi:hypothetical protein